MTDDTMNPGMGGSDDQAAGGDESQAPEMPATEEQAPESADMDGGDMGANA